MGKCMRKDKGTGDVAPVMEQVSQSQSSRGVRTRAKTLALHRLQSPPPPKPADSCYLELRSRRLVKPQPPQNLRKARQACGCGGKENPNPVAKIALISGAVEAEDMDFEPCFGETAMGCEARERGNRESTPSSAIRVVDIAISMPGSTTKRACSNAAHRSTQSVANVPSMPELEELFAEEERLQQHLFIEKYNFDIMNDMPLPGRYEWVTVRP